jgi:hypothetical protein
VRVSEANAGRNDPTTHAVLLARAGWPQVLNELQEGLCHDLNGRAASLDGLLHLLGEDGADAELLEHLGGEVRRLMDTVAVMRSFYGDVEGGAEPLLARDLVDQALAAYRRHRSVRDVEVETQVDAETPPFRANPARVLRALLIVLTRVAEAARDAGASGISLRVGAQGGAVLFDVAWPAGLDTTGTVLGDAVKPLGRLAAAEGGTLEVRGSDAAVLRFPAMGRTR